MIAFVKKRTSLVIAVAGSVLMLGAVVYFAERTGLALHIFFGIVLIPVLLAFYVGIGRLINRFQLSAPVATSIRIIFWLVPIVWQLGSGYFAGTPKAMFERFVSSPVPSSMKYFEWQGGVGIDGFYNFAFELDAEGTKALIRSLNLELNTNHVALDPVDIEYVAGKTSWVKMRRKPLASPIFFHRIAPWRMELVTDTNYNQVYIWR